MAVVRFKYVVRDRDRHGNIRYYVRRAGQPKVRLRGLPGSDEFLESYRSAIGVGSGAAPSERSFEWLCERYYRSGQFLALDSVYQLRKRSILEEVCAIKGANGRRVGDAPYKSLKRIHVCRLRDLKAAVPQAADIRVKQISALFTWAIKNELATTNPAEKVERIAGKSEGFYTWTEEDVTKFEKRWPIGTKARLAMSIMLYLGVRRSDAVLLGRPHEAHDGLSVTFQQFKGRRRSNKYLTLPVLPPLRTVLASSELGDYTWLVTEFGKPFAVAGFGNLFKDWCRKAGLPQCTSHGLRKIGAVRAAEAGASEHELMAMFGWEDANMARVYTRKAAQKKMAMSGAAKVSQLNECPTDCPTEENDEEIQPFITSMALPTGIEPVFSP